MGSALETFIFFDNTHRQDTVSLHWVNHQGCEVEYGQIGGGQLYSQHTFVGHAWVLRAPDSAVIMRCAGRPGLQRFVIPSVVAASPGPEDGTKGDEEAGRRPGPITPSNDGTADVSSDHAAIASDGDVLTTVVNDMAELVTLNTCSEMKRVVVPGSAASLHLPTGAEVRVESEGGAYLCTVVSGSASAAYSISYDPEELGRQMHAAIPANVHVYSTRRIAGFEVKLATNIRRRRRLLRALREDLRDVRRVLPREALRVLSGVRLYFNESYRYQGEPARMMCTHWDERWLEQNGNLPEKAGHVECYRVEDYLCFRATTQPAMLLHELSHCYHNRRFEDIDEAIKQAFTKAMADGKYCSVRHIHGKMQPHYAATNHMEYFAECSEAFFSTGRFRNDFFPFVHDEFKCFDLQGYEAIRAAWNPTGPEHDASWERRYDKLGRAPGDYDPHTLALVPDEDKRGTVWSPVLHALRRILRPL